MKLLCKIFEFKAIGLLVLLTGGMLFGSTWDRGDGTGVWTDAGNWSSPDSVPTASDNVYIGAVNAAGPAISTENCVGAWAAVGMGYSTTLTMTGGSLTLSSGLVLGERGSITGSFIMSGGTASIGGLTVGGTTTGTNTGVLTMSNSASLTTSSLAIGHETNAAGAVTLDDSSTLSTQSIWIRGTTSRLDIESDTARLILPIGMLSIVEGYIDSNFIAAYGSNANVAVATQDSNIVVCAAVGSTMWNRSGGTSDWNTTANWSKRVPCSVDNIYIGAVNVTGPTIADGVDVYGNWTAVGMGYSTTVTMTGGNLMLGDMTLGYSGSSTGTLSMSNDASANVNYLTVGGSGGGTNAGVLTMSDTSSLTAFSGLILGSVGGSAGTVSLGGASTLNAGSITINETSTLTIDSNAAKLILPASQASAVDSYIAAGLITVYSGGTLVVADQGDDIVVCAVVGSTTWNRNGSTSDWNTWSNWSQRVPCLDDDIYIGANSAAGPSIVDGVDAYGDWTAVGMGYSTTITMTGGSLTLGGLTIGERGSCTGTFIMSDGSANVSDLVVGGSTTGTNVGILTMSGCAQLTASGVLMIGHETAASGTVNLYGSSVLQADSIWMRGSNARINITDGKLVLPEDQQSTVNTYIGNGWISGYGQSDRIVVSDVGDYIEITAGISRGHKMLLKKGFQLQAMCYPVGYLPLNVVFDPATFIDSNFTSVNIWQDPIPYEYLGDAPGYFQWSRSVYPDCQSLGCHDLSDTNDLLPDELPYLSNLVSLQFKDEQNMRAWNESEVAGVQANYEEARLWFNKIRAKYPDVIVYTNQWGNTLAQTIDDVWLRDMMQWTQPDMLSVDDYAFYKDWDGGSPTEYYANIANLWAVAKEGIDGTGKMSIPCASYMQSYVRPAEPSGFHTMSESELYLNRFSTLAFGFKFIYAFIYLPTSYDSILFDPCDVADGTPTPKFYEMAKINGQNINLGDALICLDCNDPRIAPGLHYNGSSWVDNTIPSNITAWASGAVPYITSVIATNNGSCNGGYRGDVLISRFRVLDEYMDGSAANEVYFMLVNGLSDYDANSAATQQTIRLDFNFGATGITRLQRVSRDTGDIETVSLISDGGALYHQSFVLKGGEGDLYKFDTGTPFVSYLFPANTSTGVSITADLNWFTPDWYENADNGITYDVYFGTNQTNVTNATHASAEYKGNQIGVAYAPGTLTASTTYYWRIDEVGQSGTTTGDVWSFTTASPTTIFTDGFESNFDKWTDGGTTDWDRTTSYKYSGSYSAHAGSADNDLISDSINTSGYYSMTITFWYRDDDIDDSDNIYLQLYDGSAYDDKFELGNTLPEDTWHRYEVTIYNTGSDAQYFISDFRLKFEGTSIDSGENLWIDDASVVVQY